MLLISEINFEKIINVITQLPSYLDEFMYRYGKSAYDCFNSIIQDCNANSQGTQLVFTFAV